MTVQMYKKYTSRYIFYTINFCLMLTDPVEDIIGIFFPGWLTDHKMVAAFEFFIIGYGAVVFFIAVEIAHVEMCRDDGVHIAGGDEQWRMWFGEIHFGCAC